MKTALTENETPAAGCPPPVVPRAARRFARNSSCALALLALVAAGCGKHKTPPAGEAAPLPAAAVRVQAVANEPYQSTEEVVGTVRARLQASLEAKVSGRVLEMPVVAGQTVQAGDLIAALDVGEIQARLDQARAVREQAQRDRDRFANLLRQQAVTQAEFDAAESRFRVADAGVAEAESMLGYARVTAPFAGVISRKLADVGDLASPGRPLAQLEDPTTLRFEMDVPEALLDCVKPGQKLALHIAGARGDITGVISEIAPMADPNSRTFRVKLDLPPGAGARLGQFGRALVPVGEVTLPRVPASALVQRGQMELVFVVADRIAHLRLVKSGRRVGDEVMLVSGVNPGEQVVVDGAAALLDGQPVTVK
jgi:RND family efflux transporter MFP subunit